MSLFSTNKTPKENPQIQAVILLKITMSIHSFGRTRPYAVKFKKVMQNFILVQNKGIGQGLVKRLVPFFSKSAFSGQYQMLP